MTKIHPIFLHHSWYQSLQFISFSLSSRIHKYIWKKYTAAFAILPWMFLLCFNYRELPSPFISERKYYNLPAVNQQSSLEVNWGFNLSFHILVLLCHFSVLLHLHIHVLRTAFSCSTINSIMSERNHSGSYHDFQMAAYIGSRGRVGKIWYISSSSWMLLETTVNCVLLFYQHLFLYPAF